jgi:uncharacterized protein DUF6894
MRIENFASEIFCRGSAYFYAATRKEFTYLCGLMPKWINGFKMSPAKPAQAWLDQAPQTKDKELANGTREPSPGFWLKHRTEVVGPMPRYFFNTHIGDELVSDPEGEELRDLDRAWEVARAMIRELLKTEGAERGLLSAVLEVTDDEGEVVLEFPFAEAMLDMSDAPATKH